MSIFSPNLDKFTAVRFVAPIDTYELEVISLSVNTREVTDKETQQKSIKPIVNVTFRIENGESTKTEYRGKAVTNQFWLGEDDDSWNRLLRFVGAAKGIKFGDEAGDEAFKQMMATADLSVNSETKQLGAAFESLKKARVKCALGTKISKGEQYQTFGVFTPF